jgi:hypothetical protein
MNHFIYLFGFALFTGIVFGAISAGDTKSKILFGLKTFAQFVIVSMVLAWIFYFIPW